MKILKYNRYKYQYSLKEYGNEPPIHHFESIKYITKKLQKLKNNKNLYVHKISQFGHKSSKITLTIDNNMNIYGIRVFWLIEPIQITCLLENERIKKVALTEIRQGIVCLCHSGKVFSIEYFKKEFHTIQVANEEQVIDIQCKHDVYILTKCNKLKTYKYSVDRLAITHHETSKNVKKIITRKQLSTRWIKGILKTDNTLEIFVSEIFATKDNSKLIIQNVQDFKIGIDYIVFKRDNKYNIYHNRIIGSKNNHNIELKINGTVVKYSCYVDDIIFLTDKREAYVYIDEEEEKNMKLKIHQNIVDYHKNTDGTFAEVIDYDGNSYRHYSNDWYIVKKMKITVLRLTTSLIKLCICYILRNKKIFGNKLQILPKDIRKYILPSCESNKRKRDEMKVNSTRSKKKRKIINI